jgi:M6 family metalloprotease-like protein
MCRWLLMVMTLALSFPASAQDVRERGEEHDADLPSWMEEELARDPEAFEFRRAWHSRLLQARVRRLALAEEGIDADSLPAERAAELGAAVTGVMRIPVFPILFQNTPTRPYTQSVLQRRLFSGGGDTLTLTKLYAEMSRNVFRLDGRVYDWTRVANRDSYYEAGQNGKPPYLGELLKEVLDAVDPLVDFRTYDRDGNNYVDVVAFVHPESGGECGNSNIWSLRWTYGSAAANGGRAYRTNDGVYISDFMIQPAYECDGSTPVEVGVFAHELGHALGLPDLYSTSRPPANEGISVWGLMGKGNWNLPNSPAHMEAWSKSELGWLPVQRITRDSMGVVLQPIETVGEAIRIDVPGVDGEYFLLENRQPVGSDRNLMGAGLLIWHVDSTEIARRSYGNTVQNNTQRKGIDLEEADGQSHLDRRRGQPDDGDPFPGQGQATEFGPATSPGSSSNSGSPSGISVRNMRELGENIIVDIVFHAPLLAGSPHVAPTDDLEIADTSGPTAMITFTEELRLRDWEWLVSRDFEIVEVFPASKSVLIRLPPNLAGDPRSLNDRIMRSDVRYEREQVRPPPEPAPEEPPRM